MYLCSIAKGKTLASPDVCKTPAPPGPPVLSKNSKIAMSNGDNAGVAGGVVSNSFLQEVCFTSASSKVALKGKPAVRHLDQIKANKGNAMGSFIKPSQAKPRCALDRKPSGIKPTGCSGQLAVDSRQLNASLFELRDTE